MSHFCLLADPASYSVSDVDLLTDAEARAYWLKLFEEHFQEVLAAAADAYGLGSARQVDLARKQFAAAIAALRAEPKPVRVGPGGAEDCADGGRLGVVELCRLREKALRDHGLHDPFRHVKQRENRTAVEYYPAHIKNLTALPRQQRWERLFRGVFAGNIFDLGSAATMDYAREEVDFEAVVEQVKPRPWLVDDFDELEELLPVEAGAAAPWAKAVVFVDNAGADFVLGVMPLVRHLASYGTQIVLAANELPSLNDVTADEAVALVEELTEVDVELSGYVSAGLFEVVSTGNDIPLIDLAEVSDELNEAARDADLVILEGMGRSVESNLHAQFAVDCIQLCLLKDASVAARVGGKVFDCVCMYRPAEVEQ